MSKGQIPLSQIPTQNAIRVEAVFRWSFLKSSFSKISADSYLFSNFMADFSKLGMRRIFVPSPVFSSQFMPRHILILKNPHYL